MILKSATSRNIFSVAACGVVATVAASAILIDSAYTNIRQSSLSQMQQIASTTAAGSEKTLGAAIAVVNSLETVLSTMRISNDASRTTADAILKSLLDGNPGALGVWTGWEPNAFDGKDKDFAGKDGNDATGRYIPYWVRSGGKVTNVPLVDYTVAGAGDYYQLPFNQRKTVIIEPYSYAIDGKQVLMTSIAKPIMIDGKPVGVTGLDMALDDAQKAISAIRPMGTGFMSLVTGAGGMISHPDAALIGKNIKDGGAETAGWDQLIANPGTEREITGADGGTYFAIAEPVKLTDTTSWYAIVVVPKATVFAQVNSVVRNAIAVTSIAAILLGLAGWLIARRFVRRIENVIGETDRIANGDLDVVLKDRERRDEIGDLSRSLYILLESNRDKVRLETEAEASRATQEAERAERARINNAQEAEVKFAVSELAAGLVQLSDGNMTVRLDQPFTSALDEIRGNFNTSVEKLQAALVSFSENASVIQSGSEEIRTGADDLARRTEQQAASVEETAAALEQITTSIKDSTTRAEEAAALVSRTKGNAEQSGEIVHSAVEAMNGIEQSSQSISNIIGVIDDIAFQTNLLALNAGVEAARAGEAGKGFAVVAQEVRELAQRSATAAKEIKALIHSSGDQVKRGVSLVGQTGEALRAMVQEVQLIDRNVQAIVQSAREQSTGLQEINTAVNQMDQATQKNAAMVEESNAATHTLASEVSSLSARLGQFKLDAGRVVSISGSPRRTADMTAGTARPAAIPHPGSELSGQRALGERLRSAFGKTSAAASPAWEDF
ncbi:methyl-accepting chemotaxis protein [Rhizobium sp. BR 314]|uniref:methyl-accepting chemotaxis protein n=1 Tax=Rhizobium sp. BR 314 TaxID=3040013 RepID=UPI0039BF81F8